MKIGVISDTHINHKSADLPEEIVEAFKNVDMIIHCGDLVDLSVVEKLKNLCKNVKAVYGNMDPAELKDKLPEKEIITVGKFKIGVAHGYGAPNGLVELLTKIFKDEGVDIIVFGHSHKPLNEKRGNILFFNPGSPTDKVFSPYNSYGILDITDKIEAKIIKING